MASLDRFMPTILVEVPQCPEPVATLAMRDTLIAFCDEALVWRETVRDLETEIGVPDYELEVPSGARVATVIRVRLEGRALTPGTPDQLLADTYGDDSGRPHYYFSLEPEILTFFKTPDNVYKFETTVAYAPKRNGNQVPDYIYEQYAETIKYGTLARLLTQPAKPYTDPQLGMKYGQMYAHLTDVARVEVNKGRVRANLRVVPRPFA